ncbi:MAG: hypothetical protein KC800_19975 [Candidatus Eremiobacteraeota bacterium]|nr:hypothetical protein [Candidatus Eremiobacteraeota bacterium]
MKKILAIVLIVCMALGGLFGFWINQPTLVGESQISDSVGSAKNRFSQLQREAENPQLNGYLSLQFEPLWGAGHPINETSEIEQRLQAWNAYSNALRGGQTDHGARLKAGDTEYLAARTAFEGLLPGLVVALNKRLFVVPRKNLSGYGLPDTSGLRLLSQAIYAYVESKVAEKDAAASVEPLAALFTLGGKMQGRENLVNDLSGVTLQRTAFKALALIRPDSNLTTQDWLTLATAVTQGTPPPDQMVLAFEAEVAASLELILDNEKKAAQSGSYLDRLFLQREKRIFMNQTALQLRAVKGDNLRKYMPPTPGFMSSLTGESGNIALINTADFARAAAIMEFNRICLVGASTALDLRAYRAKNGKLPVTLQEVKEMGLRVPPDSMEYDPKEATITVKVSQKVLETINKDEFTLDGWSKVTENGLQFTI